MTKGGQLFGIFSLLPTFAYTKPCVILYLAIVGEALMLTRSTHHFALMRNKPLLLSGSHVLLTVLVWLCSQLGLDKFVYVMIFCDYNGYLCKVIGSSYLLKLIVLLVNSSFAHFRDWIADYFNYLFFYVWVQGVRYSSLFSISRYLDYF